MTARAHAPGGARAGAPGFTLLEVMVALAVVAIAFTALLGLHARNLRLAAREEAYTQALFLAESMIGETEAGLEGFPQVGESSGDFEGRFPGRYSGLRWQRIVESTPFPDTLSVTVRVYPVLDPQAAAELTLYVRPGAAA